MSQRTITLTGRPPVTIDEDAWDIIAQASAHDYEGQYDFQANWQSRWSVRVRQHDDGRAIVHATYSYTSNWQNARCYSAKRGILLPADTTAEAICDAIREVCGDIADAEHAGDDASRWTTLANECIADMPAEAI